MDFKVIFEKCNLATGCNMRTIGYDSMLGDRSSKTHRFLSGGGTALMEETGEESTGGERVKKGGGPLF